MRVHCDEARAGAQDSARRLQRHGRRAVLDRARTLAALSRAPAEHVARQRARAHQQLRELRATSRRQVAEQGHVTARRLLVLSRVAARAGLEREREHSDLRVRAAELRRAADARLERRARELARLRLAIDAHDPERTLERGYALVEDGEGGLVTSAEAARAAGRVSVRFRDDRVNARIER